MDLQKEGERMNTPEEAKFWSDKRILEEGAHPIRNNKWAATSRDKIVAIELGIKSENFDTIMQFQDALSPTEELGKVYEAIKKIINEYLDINPDYLSLLALWIMGTYFHSEFPAYPFLYINAQKGSGKTRLLKIISHFAYRGQGQVNTGITESVLFRSEQGATLLLDECESIANKDRAILREYLNASYKKGATVRRNKKIKSKEEDNYQVEVFKPYRPIAMANISGMNDVLGDRCLTLILEKSNNPAKTKLMENFETMNEFFLINKILLNYSGKNNLNNVVSVVSDVSRVNNIYRGWNLYVNNKYNNHTTLTSITPLTTLTTLEDLKRLEFFNKMDSTGINGRNLELVFPLLVLSNYLSKDIFEEVLPIFQKLLASKEGEDLFEDRDITFIDFVSTQETSQFTYIPLIDIVNRFRQFVGEIGEEEKWLNSRWVGKALKRLNLASSQKRNARGKEYIIAVSRAKEKIKMFRAEGELEK